MANTTVTEQVTRTGYVIMHNVSVTPSRGTHRVQEVTWSDGDKTYYYYDSEALRGPNCDGWLSLAADDVARVSWDKAVRL